MSNDVSRKEFDALVARVAILESRTNTGFVHIFTSLHEHDRRFDILDAKVDDLSSRVDHSFSVITSKLDEIIGRLP